MENELNRLISERENKANQKIIPTDECITRLKNAALKINNRKNLKLISPNSGHGVDVHFAKNGIEYIFDK